MCQGIETQLYTTDHFPALKNTCFFLGKETCQGKKNISYTHFSNHLNAIEGNFRGTESQKLWEEKCQFMRHVDQPFGDRIRIWTTSTWIENTLNSWAWYELLLAEKSTSTRYIFRPLWIHTIWKATFSEYWYHNIVDAVNQISSLVLHMGSPVWLMIYILDY